MSIFSQVLSKHFDMSEGGHLQVTYIERKEKDEGVADLARKGFELAN